MNHLGAGAMSSQDRSTVGVDLRSIVTDSDTATTVTVYTESPAGTMDPTTGIYSASEEGDEVSGWMAPLSLREIASSGGVYQSGDVRLIVMAADLTTDPDTRSRFRTSTTDHAVIRAERDPLALTWQLVGRRIT